METQSKAVSLLPSGESAFRTELKANLGKYRVKCTEDDAPTEDGEPE